MQLRPQATIHNIEFEHSLKKTTISQKVSIRGQCANMYNILYVCGRSEYVMNNNNNALCDTCHKSVEPDGYNELLY